MPSHSHKPRRALSLVLVLVLVLIASLPTGVQATFHLGKPIVLAADDAYAVERGATTLLPVLRNDRDGENGARLSYDGSAWVSDASGPWLATVRGVNAFTYRNLDKISFKGESSTGLTSLGSVSPAQVKGEGIEYELREVTGTSNVAYASWAPRSEGTAYFNLSVEGDTAYAGVLGRFTTETLRDPGDPEVGSAIAYGHVQETTSLDSPFANEARYLSCGSGLLWLEADEFTATDAGDPARFSAPGSLTPASLRVTAVTGATNGTAAIDPTGLYLAYTPDPAYVGLDTFTYTMENCAGLQATATVTVTVADAAARNDEDTDGYAAADCNNADAAIHPGASEIADRKDNDCNGQVDDGIDLADLTIFDLVWDPAAPVYGDGHRVNINVTIVNYGPGFSSPSTLRLAWGDENEFRPLPALKPGRPNVFEFTLEPDTDRLPIRVIVDPSDRVVEGDETNNAAEVTMRLTHVSAVGRDEDEDGFAAGKPNGDCDDSVFTIRPYPWSSTDIEDGVDNDCDGRPDERQWFRNLDGDGYGDRDNIIPVYAPWNYDAAAYPGLTPPHYHTTDCDDADPNTFPGARELPDHRDNDCDGEVDEGIDFPGLVIYDFVWEPAAPRYGQTVRLTVHYANYGPGDGLATRLLAAWGGEENEGGSYADVSSLVPGERESREFEFVASYGNTLLLHMDPDERVADAPEDLHHDQFSVQPPSGAAPWAAGSDGDGDGYDGGVDDCDDGDPTVHPGAPEVTGNFRDDDCDGRPDERDWYNDADGDGYGDPATMETTFRQPPLPNAVTQGGDCRDADPAVHPGVAEAPGDGVDNDCNGAVDEEGITPTADFAVGGVSLSPTAPYEGRITQFHVFYANYAGDLAASILRFQAGDFTETRRVGPLAAGNVEGASEAFEVDLPPGDHPLVATIQPAGTVLDPDESNNAFAATVRVASTSEIGFDSDGDGQDVEAADRYGDCNDRDPAVPGPEVVGDGLDNDCDGIPDGRTWYPDADGDGYGTRVRSEGGTPEIISVRVLARNFRPPTTSWAASDGDCDDADASIHPGALDADGDGVDQDCGSTPIRIQFGPDHRNYDNVKEATPAVGASVEVLVYNLTPPAAGGPTAVAVRQPSPTGWIDVAAVPTVVSDEWQGNHYALATFTVDVAGTWDLVPLDAEGARLQGQRWDFDVGDASGGTAPPPPPPDGDDTPANVEENEEEGPSAETPAPGALALLATLGAAAIGARGRRR